MKNLMRIYFEDDDFGYMSAYYGEIIKTKNVYIIPFINVNIIGKININGGDSTFVDMAYLVFKNYNIIDCEFYGYNAEVPVVLYSISGKEYNRNLKNFLLGGDNFNSKLSNGTIDTFDSGCDWDIECETFMLQLLESSKMINGLLGFTPFGTPNNKINMDLQESINFMKNKYLPENLKNLIKNDKPKKIYEIYEKQKIVTEPFII